jgi:hypothetical protein
VLLLAFAAIIFAVVKVGKNMKAQKNAPEIRVFAKLSKLSEQQNSNLSVDTANSRTDSTYYADFTLLDKSKVSFKVKKKQFLTLAKGDKGTLTYKGNKLISFEKSTVPVQKKTTASQKNDKFFFANPQKTGTTVKFYADAPGLDVAIPSDEPISCDFSEVGKYINKLLGSGADNFFVLEKASGEIVQFANDGKGQNTEIDIPLPGSYSYKGMLISGGDLLNCVKDFFEDTDLINKYKLTKEQF